MNKLFFKIPFKNIAIIALIAIFFIADRILKSLAIKLKPDESFALIGQIFTFKFTPNYHIAFSLPLEGWILNAIIVTVVLLLIYYIFYLILNKKNNKREILLLTVILFGAISNILDRCLYGYVVDYLELRFFTVFNLADVMISGGALLMIIFNFNFKDKRIGNID